MENIAKPALDALRKTVVKKFLLTILTIAALSGAVLVTHSSPAAACMNAPGNCHWYGK